jgi:hypothetical protein
MPTNIFTPEEIEKVIVKYFPPPAQPSDAVDAMVEHERQQARLVVRDVLRLVLSHASGVEIPT